uniref:Uncharacterized protein n=1 Tax=Anguilla anguilla TaxID=7936 RepID=A0A0E9UYF3_ANGAN
MGQYHCPETTQPTTSSCTNTRELQTTRPATSSGSNIRELQTTQPTTSSILRVSKELLKSTSVSSMHHQLRRGKADAWGSLSFSNTYITQV